VRSFFVHLYPWGSSYFDKTAGDAPELPEQLCGKRLFSQLIPDSCR
jgi:hypothetical protein